MNGLYQEARLAALGVWRRRWLALAVAWGVALAGWLALSLFPNSYESRARIFVQTQTLLPNKLGILPAEQTRDIDRVRQTLTSTVNLEKVVRGTDLAAQAKSDKDVALLVEQLRLGITIKPTVDNIVELSAKVNAGGFSDAERARLSRAVVQKLIDIFVEENLTGDRDETSQTMRFLDAELAKRETQLREAEARQVEFEQKYMGLLPGVGSIGQRLEAARAELSSVESQLIAAQSSLAAVTGQMGGTPATIAGPAVAGAGVGGARAQIAAVQAQMSDGAARGWTDQHPDMIAMRAQIARLQGSAAREPRGGGGSMANPLYMSLRTMQAEKQATVAALGSRKAQLESDMAQFTAKQAEEPEIAAEQSRLSRDHEVLKQQYDKLLADREDVKLRADVNTKTDAIKFRVIDPPSAPRVPVAPNRPLLLGVVLILALGAGVGTSFAINQLRTTYATADRLQAATGLPVLGAVSQVVTEPARIEEQRRLKWFAGGTGGLVACFVVLLLVEFVQRGLVA